MTTLEQLAQRIESLENQNRSHARQTRRWRTCAVSLGVLGLGAISIAAAPFAAPSRVLQTERLEILDNNGKLLMRLGRSDDGNVVQFDLWNNAGEQMMRISGNDHGGDIALFNTNQNNVAGLYATATGGEMAVWNQDGGLGVKATGEARGGSLSVHAGKQQLCAIHAADQGGQIDLYNSAGAQVARTGVNTHGGEMALWRSDNTPAFDAGAANTGGAANIYNGQGKRVTRLDSDDEGNGRQIIHQSNELPVITFTGKFAPSAIAVSNERRQTVASLGNNNLGGVLNINNAGGETMADYTVGDAGGAMRILNSQMMTVLSAGVDASSAGSINVMNNRGIAVTTLNADPEGAGVVAINDQAGKPRCRATAGGAGGGLQLINSQTQPVAVLGVSSGGGSLTITNNAGSRVGILGSDADGVGRLDIATASGTNVITASAVADTGGVFTILNSQGHMAAQLLPSDGGGTLNLHDPGGNPLLIAGYSKNTGGAGLSLKNRRGVRIFYAGPDDRGTGTATIWDPDGRYPVQLGGDR